MAQLFRVILNEDGYTTSLLRAYLTSTQLSILEGEIQIYNDHIEKLQNGTAPRFCYDDTAFADKQYIAHHQRSYVPLFERPENRGHYEIWNVFLAIVDENGLDCEDNEYFTDDQPISHKQSIDFFTLPYKQNDNISLGYGLLPFVGALLES